MTSASSPAVATPNPLQGWCSLACFLFGVVFVAHAGFAVSAMLDALGALSKDAFAQVGAELRRAASDATYAAFCVLGWIAVAWMSRNHRVASTAAE